MSSPTHQKLRILFVDDEAPIREVFRVELAHMGHDVTVCDGGKQALEQLEKQTFDVAIVDLRMPGMGGWEVVAHIKKVAPDTEVVIHTGHANMDEAIQAVRAGAYDFLQKPCNLAGFATVLQRVADRRTMVNQKIALETRLKSVEGATDLVGATAPMQRVKTLIAKIAPTDSNVLILGETGTGKELVARSIHEQSKRANMPFVAVNCGALPDNLVESELFGHRKGAFTGADTPRKGLIEVANGGTLFLDELGELDKSMQVKLLRFLESGEVRRLGENEAFHVDVRVVCATNRDLQEMVEKGTFREDLFFRVNTFEIRLPALRDRKDDIPDLARTLIARQLKRRSVPAEMLSPEVVEILKRYDWSGNVRELANALEHAVILSDGQTIRRDDLPTSVLRVGRKAPAPAAVPVAASSAPAADASAAFSGKTLREIEMEVIHQVLDKYQGDKPKTAQELGIALKTLYNKLNQSQQPAAAG